jgi:hypothetical protein
MELKIKEFNNLIIHCCKTIQDSHGKLESILKNYDCQEADRSLIDRNLIKMCVASQKLMNLVLPVQSTGEIYGLPEEVTKLDLQDGLLIADKEHPDWDFKNWFKEKVSAIKDGVNELMEWLETDPEEYKIKATAQISAKEFITDMINSCMRRIHPYAQTILDMIRSGRLTVKNVRLEVEED